MGPLRQAEEAARAQALSGEALEVDAGGGEADAALRSTLTVKSLRQSLAKFR